MTNHTIFGVTVFSRHTPLIRGGLHQHHPGRGAALSNILLTGSEPLAATGREIAPHAFTRQVLTRRWELPSDVRPITLEFFGHKLSKPSQRALTHFRSGNPNSDRIVARDVYPSIDFFHAGRSARELRENA